MTESTPSAGPVQSPGRVALAAAMAFGVAAAVAARSASGGIPPLDDAYIYLQYARLAAAGHPFRYGAGEPLTTGATGAGWLAIVTLLTLVSRAIRAAPETLVFAAQGALSGAVLWGTARLAARGGVRKGAAWPAALLLTAMPLWLFGAFNGMETLLHGAGLLLVVAVLRGASPWWLVVPAFARPSGALLAIAASAWLFVRGARDRRRLAAVALVATLGVAWPWLLTGQPPLTWAAKALAVEPHTSIRAYHVPHTPYFALRALWFGLSGARPQPPQGVVADLARPGAWLAWVWVTILGGGAIAALVRRRGRDALLVWSVASLEAVLTVAWDGQEYRYLAAPLPPLVLAAVQGWAEGRRGRAVPAAAVVLLALVHVAPPAAWTRFRSRFAARSAELAAGPIATGRWIDAHLPAGARIALHDAGAIAYFGRRPVVDLVGLVSPELKLARRSGEGAVWEVLSGLPAARRPTHAAVVVPWIPRLAQTTLFDRRLMTTADPAGRAAFEVWSLAWPGGADARLENVPAAFGPGAGQDALAIVDGVDVGSLASERAHGYSAAAPADPRESLTVVRDLGFAGGTAPGAHVIEGGRDETGAVTFTLAAEPGRPALVVLRTASSAAARLTVTVGDHEETIAVPRDESAYHELDALFDARVIDHARGGDGRIAVTVAGDRRRAFHWWLLQPAVSP